MIVIDNVSLDLSVEESLKIGQLGRIADKIDDMDKIREDNDIKLFNIFLKLNKITLSDF